MTVTSPMPNTDAQIQADVLAELKWDARVAPNEIGVSVTRGVVTLMGRVDRYTKRWAAEEAALGVRGVKAVANEIEVQLSPSDSQSDTDIAAAARERQRGFEREDPVVVRGHRRVVAGSDVRRKVERQLLE